MKRVYIDYQDGNYWLTERPNRASSIEIPSWQWLAYRAFEYIAVRVSRWIAGLDNSAYKAREARSQQ